VGRECIKKWFSKIKIDRGLDAGCADGKYRVELRERMIINYSLLTKYGTEE
jgi:hypothetical protein